MPAERLPLPTFLIIGAQKSATRWLRLNLAGHPDVFMAAEELSHFSSRRRYRLGLDAYRAGFEGWAGEPVVGESTPAYMMRAHRPDVVAERIDESLPDVRLVALLRNPIDRAHSAFLHHVRRERIPQDAELVSYVAARAEDDPLDLIAGGHYAASLRTYVARFGERLHVALLDEVLADPFAVYARVAEHVGASAGFYPAQLERVRFSRRNAREPGEPPRAEDDAKLTPEQRMALWPLFADDVGRLEDLIGRSLAHWSPRSSERTGG